jgi:MFS family permease
MHKLDKKHDKDGLVSGIISLFSDIGWAIGPLIAGITYFILGPTIAIAIGAVPIAAMLVVYHVAVRKHAIKVSILDAPRKPHKHRHKI